MKLQRAILYGLGGLSLMFVLACGGGGGGVSGSDYLYGSSTSRFVQLPIGGGASMDIFTGAGSLRRLSRSFDGLRAIFFDGTNVVVADLSGANQMTYATLKAADFNVDGTMLYGVTQDNKLVSLNLDGSGQTQIFDGNFGSGIGAISVSSDGSKIALIYGPSGWNQVYTINPDGTGLDAITSPGANHTSVEWNPSGQKLLVTRLDNVASELYELDAVSKGETQLTTSVNLGEREAIYSTDGSLIYYLAGPATGPFDVYRMNSNGSGAQMVSDGSTQFTDLLPFY